MADEMKVSLPEGVVKPIIEAQVIAALQGQERLITEMVKFVMNQKVRDAHSYQDVTMVESICRNMLREAIENSVREWVASQADALKAEVLRQLSAKRKSIAEELVRTMVDGAKDRWKLTVNATIAGRE
jgi:hypothetical protein